MELVKEQFIDTRILYNAFDSSDFQSASLLYQEGKNLDHYLVGLPEECEWQVGLNGKPIAAEDYATTELTPTDKLVIVMVPQGGGAKSILRMVAMVALVVGAMVLFGPGGALVGPGLLSATGGYIAMATTMVAGSLLINALLPPQVPKADTESGTNYGYDGAKNTAREGVPIPVVYGEFRVAGNYVDLYTENQGNTQYLYGRAVLSDGVIDGVSDIELNEQPIGDFQDVLHGHTLGTNTEKENIYFGRSIAAQTKGNTLNTTYSTHTTTTEVDSLQVNTTFPTGLVRYTDKGKKRTQSVTLNIGYRKVGTSTWTTANKTYNGATTKTLRNTYEITFPERGEYEVRVKRATAEAVNDDQVYDNVVLTEIAEIQASNVALRSVATGWYRIKMTDQLNGIPRITWKTKGVTVNHYNSSGTVTSKAWTNNPAWIVLDMLIGDERGSFKNIPVDYQAFVEWAAYCDSNNLKFNGVFDETMSLWDCMSKVYKVGRAMPIRIGTKLSVAIDKPSEPVMMFGAGNIEKDTFQINYLPLTDRANEFEVSYYDKDDNNKKKTIRIIDPDAEARGELPRPVSFELFGVDNFEQAQKEVWYQLYQNRLTRKTVTFSAPVESIGLTLGDVALIQHDMVDWGISGRILKGISTTEVQLDKDITVADGDTLMVIFDEISGETDVIEERTITAIDEETNTVTVSAPFSAIPQDMHNYMLGHAAFVSRPFRLRSISGEDLHSRQLTFVEYNELVYGPPEQVIPAPDVKAPIGIVSQVQNLDFTNTADYLDTKEKDVKTTVVWTSGHIRKYAGADVYVATIAQADYDAGETTPNYDLYQTINNGNSIDVIAEYDDYVFVKVVAFDTDGRRANFTSAPAIFALVADPVTLTPPKKITDGSEFAYTLESDTTKLSFEFTYDGVVADIDGFYLDVEYSNNASFTDKKKERFILQPNQRAIILGNVNADAYYRFSVMSYKRVHDIFNDDGIATSSAINAHLYPYQPSATSPFVGDIEDSITTSNPYIDVLDFINFNPVSETQPTVTISKPAVTVPADEDGYFADLSQTGTEIEVRQGEQILSYDGVGSAAGSWKIHDISTVECSAGSISDGGANAIAAPLASITDGPTVKSAQVTWTIKGHTLGNKQFTLTITQNITKLIGALVDTTPPSIPTNLTLTSRIVADGATGNPQAILRATWTASPETDVAGYVLALRLGTGNFIEYKLDKDTSFEIPVSANTSYGAKIKAYDRYANTSGFSSIVTHTTVKDTVPPATPTGLTATASFQNIFLEWDNPSDSDLASVEIWERLAASGSFTMVDTVNANPSAKGRYTRSGLANNQTAYFRIIAVDTSGNKSDATSLVNATTPRLVDDDIAAGAINTAKFASGIKPVEIVSSLPTSGNTVGRTVFLTTDNKLYRYDGSAFVATVDAEDISGQIKSAQIENDSITVAKFADGLAPVEVLSSLPTTGNFEGRTVYLTTNSKLYRYDGSSFTASVASDDIQGQLTNAQIATLAASKITGEITSGQIAANAITTAKFASGLKPVEVLSSLPTSGNTVGRTVFLTTDNKLYRYNGSSFVATVEASDLTGQITNTQITDNAITTDKIAANTITANKLKLIPNGQTINADPAIRDTSIWLDNINTYNEDGWLGGRAFISYSSTRTLSELIPIDINKTYRSSFEVRGISASDRLVYGLVGFYDKDGNHLVANAGNGANWPSEGTFHYYGLIDQVAPGQRTRYSINFGAGQTAGIPAGAAFVRLGALYGRDGTQGGNLVGSFMLQEVVPAELIVDGAITTDKLAANTVTAGKIATGAINAEHVAAKAITADKVAIGDFTNLVSGSGFEADEVHPWVLANNRSEITDYAANSGTKSLRMWYDSPTVTLKGDTIPCKPGEKFYVEFYCRKSSTFDGNGNFKLRFGNDNNSNSLVADIGFGASSIALPDIFYKKTLTFTIPTGCTRLRVALSAGSGTSGAVYLDDIVIRRMNEGELLVDGSITTDKIAANAVNASKIAANSIDASKIVSNTITANQLATNAITTDKIAANAITSGKIQAGAISTTELAANAITTDKLATASVTTEKLLVQPSNMITNGSFINGFADWQQRNGAEFQSIYAGSANKYRAVRFAHPGDGSSQFSSLFSNGKDAYTGTDRASTGFELKPGHSYKFTMESVQWGGFVGNLYARVYYLKEDNTIGDSQILWLGKPTSSWAEYGGEFTAPAGVIKGWMYIYLNDWTAGTVFVTDIRLVRMASSELIVDGAITADKLSANSVVAGKIAANAVTAGTIQAGAVSTNELAAGSITTEKLSVSSGNLISNGDFRLGWADWLRWSGNHGTDFALVGGGVAAPRALRFVAPDSPRDVTIFTGTNAYSDTDADKSAFLVEPGKTYRVSFDVVRSGDFAVNRFEVKVYYHKGDGTYTTNTTLLNFNSGDFTTTWGSNTKKVGTFTAPEGAYAAHLYFAARSMSAGSITFTNVKCSLMSDAELIVDGSIVADKIASNAVTANKIAANAITADKIQAGSITGDKISTSTSLPGTITVGTTGVSIETVKDRVDSVANATWERNYYVTSSSNYVPLLDAKGSEISGNVLGITGGNKTRFRVTGVTAPTGTDTETIAEFAYNGSSWSVTQISSKGTSSNHPQFVVSGGKPCVSHYHTNGYNIRVFHEMYPVDSAAAINANTTKIDPGKITVSGSTTLSDWRNGSDTTKIEGGSIAANTISANKLEIGLRGVEIHNIEFEANRATVGGSVVANRVAWTAGEITYTDDDGVVRRQSVSAGNTGTYSSGHWYIYWSKGSSSLTTSSSAATSTVGDKIVLATYKGGNELVVNYGRTIIDGDKITTGTIAANKLNVGTLSAITANIGLLRTASSGARTEIENNQIRVYDSSGNLRVRMGIW